MKSIEKSEKSNDQETVVIDSCGWMHRCAAKLRLVLAASVLLGGSMAMAQHAPPAPQPRAQPQHGMQPAATEDRTDGESAMSKQMKPGRDMMRHKLLVEKTHQLLQLTDELRIEVDKTDQNVMSLEVIRKSQQIEKLAKSIHELMVSSS